MDRRTEWWECSNGLYGARIKKGVAEQTALTKLAAFEDTGKEPKEIKEILAKIAEGRMVELPCKVGDTVWVVSSDGEIYECVLRNMLTYKAVNYNLEIGRHIDGMFEGKQTVHLTPESAQNALKGEEGER